MNQTLKDRLISFLSYKGIGQGKFEKMCGLSNGYVNSLRRAPGSIKLNQILSAFPELNRSWLLTGDGPMLLTDAQPDQNTVPLIPISAAGGILPGDDQGVALDECPRVLSPEPTAEIAIDVTGESMTPAYPPGCRVFARRVNDSAAIRYGDVYILDTTDGAVIKRIMPAEAHDAITAASLNPHYPPYLIPKSEIRSIWRAICRLIYQ